MQELENLDDVSFAELMEKSVSEIPQLCPEWTDFNAHDPGITFLEMLMWLTEMQRYYLFQITERHLASYLRLIGTSARPAEPTVILARFSAEEAVFVEKDTVFYIGSIPYRLQSELTLAPEKPRISRENGEYQISFFTGKRLLIYFSPAVQTAANPMRDGFYQRAEIKGVLLTDGKETDCKIIDRTYGLFQSGIIEIEFPFELRAAGAVFRLIILSDDEFQLPQSERFEFFVCELLQLDSDGATLGESGRVRENVWFSAEKTGRKITGVVNKEIKSGKNAETEQEAFRRFRAERQQLSRAVNKDDYLRLALQTPGLQIQCAGVFSKEAGKVSVCVKTTDGRLREHERKNLKKVLFAAKPVGTEIEILTPIIYSARLTINVQTDGWAGSKKLTQHIQSVFAPLEKTMGAVIDMPQLLAQIDSAAIVLKIDDMLLRLGKGVELHQRDRLQLAEDCLISLDEIIIE